MLIAPIADGRTYPCWRAEAFRARGELPYKVCQPLTRCLEKRLPRRQRRTAWPWCRGARTQPVLHDRDHRVLWPFSAIQRTLFFCHAIFILFSFPKIRTYQALPRPRVSALTTSQLSQRPHSQPSLIHRRALTTDNRTALPACSSAGSCTKSDKMPRPTAGASSDPSLAG
jgi:hypothetical protein